MRKIYLALFVALLLSGICLAQDQGAIYGQVQTMEKAALRNTQVRLESASLFSGFIVVETDQRGQFRFNNLPGGSYRLILKKDGFQDLEIPVFNLNHGNSRKLSLVMISSHMNEVVVLDQKAGEKDTTDGSNSFHKDYSQITTFSNLRTILYPLRRIPGFNDFSGHGAVEEAGVNVMIDGVPVMDPGKGLFSAALSQNAIQEIEVNMFGAPVSTETSMGPSVNLITRKGSAELHGEISTFLQSADWTGDNTGAYQEEGIRIPVASSFNNPAFSLGGSIAPEQLWFFVSGNLFNRNTQRQLLDGTIDVERTSQQYNASLTGKLPGNQEVGLSLFSNQDDISHQPWRDIWSDNYEASLHKKDQYFDLYHAYHNIDIADNIAVMTSASLFSTGLFLKPIEEGEIKYDQATGQFLEGTKNSHSRSEEGYRQNLSINLNYYNDYFFGRHNFNVGLEYERRVFERINDQQALALYWNGDKYKLFNYGLIESKSRIRRSTAYIDDNWSLNPRLTVNLGLRVDATNHIASETENSPAGNEDFITFTDYSYRIGFAYDAFGDGKTIIKGSAGRYYKTPLVGNTEPLFTYYPLTRLYYGSAILGPAVGDQWILWNEYNNRLPLEVDPDLGNEYTEGFYLGFERELNSEYSLAMDLVWKKDHNIIGITYPETIFTINNADHEGLHGDYSGIYYRIINKGSYALYTNPKEGDPGVASPLYRKYYAVTASLTKALTNNYSFNLNYTFSRNEGTVDNSRAEIFYGQDYFGNPNYFINRDGSLGLERPHALKFTGSAFLPYGFSVSTYFRFLSGRPFYNTVSLGGSELLSELNDGSQRMPSQFLWDIRIQKEFTLMDRYRLTLISDIFNILNDDALTSYISTNIDSENYLKPGSIVNARFFQVGARLTF